MRTGAGLLLLLAACSPSLPDLGAVPSFELTDQDGTAFGQADLTGHVWIANFIFTRCPDVCPALSARMAGLQTALGDDAATRLVSFTVDPGHDTPEVLAEYARRVGAGGQWRFLTGSRATLSSLLRDGFHVAFADDGPSQQPITHSDRFALIDPAGRIRGYYHGADTDDMQRLTRDARALGRAGS